MPKLSKQHTFNPICILVDMPIIGLYIVTQDCAVMLYVEPSLHGMLCNQAAALSCGCHHE